MPAKDLNKIQALKDEAFVEGDVDEDFLERFAEETGWKSVLLYQYLSGYIVMIAMTSFLAAAIAWLELMHSCVTQYPTEAELALPNLSQSIIYLLDCIYFIDILFRGLYALTRWPNKKLYNESVSIEFIILDIISVIPSCMMYSAVQKNAMIVSIMRLRVLIRLYRIPTAISTLKKMFHQISILSTVLWSVAVLLLGAILPSSIHYVGWCFDSDNCKFRDYRAYMGVYFVGCRCLLTIGADMDVFSVPFVYHLYSFLSMLYFMFTMYLVAELACKSIDNMKARYNFIHDYEKTMDLYKNMKEMYKDQWQFEDDQIYSTLKEYYYHYLRERNGIAAFKVLHKILPASLTKNIIMDMAFDSFRHSHIFRNLDLNIVGFLSTLVKFEFAVPGQVIVHKGEMFNKMIYISHGVLQILSHEDGETPVLNLSGGTSLGETTLFISYALKCTIICQTYSELVILEKNDFQEMIVAYATEYRELVKKIIERFEDGKKMRKIVYDRMDPYLIKSDLLIMSWIKQFQRCFLHDREGEGTNLDSKIRGLQYYIDNLIFYVSYLDKLVVSEEIELVKDSVFLKSSYHFILQPQSPILIVWNVVVLMLAILFIIIYPFNLCYPIQNKSIQTVYTIFITFLFWIDIYLQMFTAVRTRGATYLTFKSILVYRIRQKEFLIDCAAALPLEYFIMFLSGNIPDVVFMLLQGNRLLKYYKLNCFFGELNIWSTRLLTVINYAKFITHYLFFYYYAAMITYILNCYNEQCTNEFNNLSKRLGTADGYYKLWSTVPMSSSLVTGIIIGRMPYGSSAAIFLGYTLVGIFAYILYILYLVNVIASSAIHSYPLLKQQEELLGIAQALDWFDVTKTYKTGVAAYLNTLFFFNSDIYVHYNELVLPKELGASFRNVHLSRILVQNAFFKNIPVNMINYLTSYVKMVIIPAGLVVFYCGQAIEEFYIIQQGHCTMWYGTNKKHVTVNENLGLAEVLLGVPIFHTIVTTTDCILLKISKQDIQRCLHVFDKQSDIVYGALREFARCEQLLSRNTEQNQENLGDILFKIESTEEVSTKKKSKVSLKKKVVETLQKVYVYRIKVIRTRGSFFFYWEITKNIALVLSLFLTAFAEGAVKRGRGDGYFYILVLLDLFSWVDMFLRMLVTYYDTRGLEVQRTSKTFVYYLSHSFLIDLIGAFPFDICFTSENLFLTRLNRFLLTYRVFGLAYYLTKRIKRVRQYVYVAYVLVFAAFAINTAIYYISVKCEYKQDTGIYNCASDSWIQLSLITDQTDQWYAEAFLYFTSIFFGIGFRRYDTVNFWERIMLTLWGIVGHISMVIFLGRAVSYYLFRNADLTTYQEAMRDLVGFMSYCDIDRNIKYEVIQHFEYIWEKREGKDIANVISNFPTSVKKDLLFNIYGMFLKKTGSVFSTAEDNFLKSLLIIAKQETFRKTGIIYKIDDIHGKIFYLLKGNVEVVGPDTNRLVTLSAGSLFGCLDNCEECRQTLTMVANGHVETLSFLSIEFYSLLLQHPKFHNRFFSLANMQFDFIQSAPTTRTNYKKRTSKYENRLSFRPMMRRINFCKIHTKIFKPSKHFFKAELALYFFEFFLGTIIELLMMMLFENTALLLISYLRDLLWVIRMYFIFHFAFEDEYGMLEFRRRKIALRYIHQKDGFYFDLFCLLPFECFVYFFSWNDKVAKANAFFWLRFNRLFRVFYLFRYMSKTTKKLNINVLLMRIAYTLMYAYAYIAAKFFFFFWCATLLDRDEDWPDYHHLHIATHYLDVICFMFTKAPVPYLDTFSNWGPTALCVVMYLDACVLVFFVCSFTGILQITTKVKSKYLSICRNLKLLMLICDASPPLIDKVQMYTNILLRIRNGNQFPFLLERAPYYLREAVLNSMFGFHLRNHYLFKDCHIDFLRQLSATMRTLTYFEGNHISDKGDIDGTMYFIQEGVILALTKDTLYTEVCEHLLVAGESFGLNQILYPHCGQYYSYRTSVLSTLVTIKREEFVRLLTFFPSVKKHIYNRAMEFAS